MEGAEERDRYLRSEVSRIETCAFPAHKGERWEDVVTADREYVEFLVGGDGPDMNEDLYDYLIDLLEGES